MKPKKSILLFILPGFLLYFMFSFYPTIHGFFISITDWNGINPTSNNVGFRNYVNLFTNDSVFIKSLSNTFKFMIFVVILQTVFSLVLAIYLAKNTRYNVALRSLFFFPFILSSVAVAFIWSFMYDSSFGFIRAFLSLIGSQADPGWLSDPEIAIYSLAFVQVWGHFGQVMIIFIAGLHSIPQQLYEVAKLEGATKWQTFKGVTWPLLAPATAIVVAYTTVQSFKAFDIIIATTGGGPNNSTEILSTFIYNAAFSGYRFGYAAAASVIFMVIIAAIAVFQFTVLRADRVKY